MLLLFILLWLLVGAVNCWITLKIMQCDKEPISERQASEFAAQYMALCLGGFLFGPLYSAFVLGCFGILSVHEWLKCRFFWRKEE